MPLSLEGGGGGTSATQSSLENKYRFDETQKKKKNACMVTASVRAIMRTTRGLCGEPPQQPTHHSRP